MQEVNGRLLAHPFDAGDVVGGVAAERDRDGVPAGGWDRGLHPIRHFKVEDIDLQIEFEWSKRRERKLAELRPAPALMGL